MAGDLRLPRAPPGEPYRVFQSRKSQSARVEAFIGRAEFLVDAVFFIQELLDDATGQAPTWDDDVARECLLRLGGAPSPEHVQRLVDLRLAAGWLRTE